MGIGTQQDLDALWERLNHEDAIDKVSNRITMRLSRMYRSWNLDTQQVADQTFRRWLNSENPSKRFDARSLIAELRILEAVPDLRVLRERLKDTPGPEALYELRRVDEILTTLGAGHVVPESNSLKTRDPMQVTRSPATWINDRGFTSHALDSMEARGLTPTVVEHTIQNGQPCHERSSNTTTFFDRENDVRVVVGRDGCVETVC